MEKIVPGGAAGEATSNCEVCNRGFPVGELKLRGLPIREILTNKPIAVNHCSACNGALDRFCEGKCGDLGALPGGPLRAVLRRMNTLLHGQRALDALGWLAERCATISFRNSEMLAGGVADEVELVVNVGGSYKTIVRPTLEEAIAEAAGKQ